MKKYRKRPVVIEAAQLIAGNFREVAMWVNRETKDRVEYGNETIIIHTLEGEMRAVLGDWIIKGVKDEFYPCKPDIFEMTYEEEK